MSDTKNDNLRVPVGLTILPPVLPTSGKNTDGAGEEMTYAVAEV